MTKTKIVGLLLFMLGLLLTFPGLKELAAAHDDAENKGRFFPHKRIYTAVRVDNSEDSSGQIKIQSGFKMEVKDNSGLFFAYSIKSLLDVQEQSEPFRDINHNPEIFFEIKSNAIPFMYKDTEYIQWGYEHESNGVNDESVGPEGRTNRSRTTHGMNIQPYFELRPNLMFSPKIWWNFQEFGNEDIGDFYGNVDLTLEYTLHQSVFTAKLRGNPFVGKGRIVMDVSYPMTGTNLFWFAQYFDGYGETLLNYNQYTQSFRLGIMLSRH